MTPSELKKLQSERNSLKNEISELGLKIAADQRTFELKKKKLVEISEKINGGNKKKITITEHAVLRLLERRFGQGDIINKAINHLQDELDRLDPPSDCKIILQDGLEAVIKNNFLTTLVPKFNE